MNSFVYHGASVFTTLRVQNRRAYYLEEHLLRLKAQADHFGFDFPGNNVLTSELEKSLSPAPLLRVRFTIAENCWNCKATPISFPNANIYDGVKAIISEQQIHPQLGKFKTGNYLPYLLAKKEAEQKDAFEGLLLDCQGHIVDGSRTSPILYRDRHFVCLSGGLDGITREMVLNDAEAMGAKISYAKLKPEHLDGQLLLAGSLVGLVPVGKPCDSIVTELVKKHKIRI